MADPRTIYQGENHIMTRKFNQTNGDDIDFDIINNLTVTLEKADGTDLEIYTYNPGTGFTAGLSHLGNSEFQLEITENVTATFEAGTDIFARWDLKVQNAAFPQDNEERDIIREHILSVI